MQNSRQQHSGQQLGCMYATTVPHAATALLVLMPSKFLIRLCAIKVLMHRKQDLPQVDKDDHQGQGTSVGEVLKEQQEAKL